MTTTRGGASLRTGGGVIPGGLYHTFYVYVWQDSVTLISSIAANSQGRDLAWQFFKDNFQTLKDRYKSGSRFLNQEINTKIRFILIFVYCLFTTKLGYSCKDYRVLIILLWISQKPFLYFCFHWIKIGLQVSSWAASCSP